MMKKEKKSPHKTDKVLENSNLTNALSRDLLVVNLPEKTTYKDFMKHLKRCKVNAEVQYQRVPQVRITAESAEKAEEIKRKIEDNPYESANLKVVLFDSGDTISMKETSKPINDKALFLSTVPKAISREMMLNQLPEEVRAGVQFITLQYWKKQPTNQFYIYFESKEVAEKAKAFLIDLELESKKINVSNVYYRLEDDPVAGKKVLKAKIPLFILYSDLDKLFRTAESIKMVKMRGFAEIHFKSQEEASEALAAHADAVIKGTKLQLSILYEDPTEKKQSEQTVKKEKKTEKSVNNELNQQAIKKEMKTEKGKDNKAQKPQKRKLDESLEEPKAKKRNVSSKDLQGSNTEMSIDLDSDNEFDSSSDVDDLPVQKQTKLKGAKSGKPSKTPFESFGSDDSEEDSSEESDDDDDDGDMDLLMNDDDDTNDDSGDFDDDDNDEVADSDDEDMSPKGKKPASKIKRKETESDEGDTDDDDMEDSDDDNNMEDSNDDNDMEDSDDEMDDDMDDSDIDQSHAKPKQNGTKKEIAKPKANKVESDDDSEDGDSDLEMEDDDSDDNTPVSSSFKQKGRGRGGDRGSFSRGSDRGRGGRGSFRGGDRGRGGRGSFRGGDRGRGGRGSFRGGDRGSFKGGDRGRGGRGSFRGGDRGSFRGGDRGRGGRGSFRGNDKRKSFDQSSKRGNQSKRTSF